MVIVVSHIFQRNCNEHLWIKFKLSLSIMKWCHISKSNLRSAQVGRDLQIKWLSWYTRISQSAKEEDQREVWSESG